MWRLVRAGPCLGGNLRQLEHLARANQVKPELIASQKALKTASRLWGMPAMSTGLGLQRALGSTPFVAVKLLIAALALIAATGCSRGLNKSAVKGTVKFKKGEVVDRGMIEFSPVEPKSGNQSGARISDGTYEISQEKGLRPGKYIVRISAPSGLLSGQGAPGSGKMELPKERVSEKYNAKSKLEVEVSPEPLQTFDFEVD
jgi:hypothetical protein